MLLQKQKKGESEMTKPLTLGDLKDAIEKAKKEGATRETDVVRFDGDNYWPLSGGKFNAAMKWIAFDD